MRILATFLCVSLLVYLCTAGSHSKEDSSKESQSAKYGPARSGSVSSQSTRKDYGAVVDDTGDVIGQLSHVVWDNLIPFMEEEGIDLGAVEEFLCRMWEEWSALYTAIRDNICDLEPVTTTTPEPSSHSKEGNSKESQSAKCGSAGSGSVSSQSTGKDSSAVVDDTGDVIGQLRHVVSDDLIRFMDEEGIGSGAVEEFLSRMWEEWSALYTAIRDNICDLEPVTTTTPKPSCRLAVCVAVDSTSNTPTADFTTQMEFAGDLLALLDLGAGDQFGITTYAYTFHTGFAVNEFRNYSEALSAITTTTRVNGNTLLSQALLGLEDCLASADQGNRKIGILLSDSPPEDVNATFVQADQFRYGLGAELWTVGVGNADPAIMADLAVAPEAAYMMTSFSDLVAGNFPQILYDDICSFTASGPLPV